MIDKVTANDIITAINAMEAKKAKDNGFYCPLCGNTGLVKRCFDEFGEERFGDDMKKEGSYDYFYPCKCVSLSDDKIKQNNRNFAGIPLLYKNADFTNFDTQIYAGIKSKENATSALNDAKAFVSHFDEYERLGMGLYIYSDTRGCGKSRLASSIGNELIKNSVRVKYESANQILSEIQRTWNDKSVSEASALEKYTKPRVLIVDDLGARSGQDWIDEKFLMIIDSRYQSKKVTVFTSNYDIERLPFKDTRIIDRLTDIERFHPVVMPNESVRTKARVKSGDMGLFYKVAYT